MAINGFNESNLIRTVFSFPYHGARKTLGLKTKSKMTMYSFFLSLHWVPACALCSTAAQFPQTAESMGFGDLKSPTSLQMLNNYLEDKSSMWYVPSKHTNLLPITC